MSDNIVDKFQGIRAWVHIFKKKATYLYNLKNTKMIEEQRAKVAVLTQRMQLIQQELSAATTKLQDMQDAIPVLEKWIAEHQDEYNIKEQFASDEIQKLAEKVKVEQDAQKVR